jgi:hypothetical protein
VTQSPGWYTDAVMSDWINRVLAGGAWLQAKRNKHRDIFILKAMSNVYRADMGFAIDGSPLDLYEIEGLIRMAQLRAAGCHTGDSCNLEPLVSPQVNSLYAGKLRTVCLLYGLPSLHDPHRINKIESILHDTKGLKFIPPRSWIIT